jgi:hypothetical protein
VVLPLALDEVGDDAARGDRPVLVRGDDERGTVREVDLQLQEEADPTAVAVVLTGEPDLPAVPAVGEDGLERVGSRSQQWADVVGLHLEVRSVGREPWGELEVADASAVQEELVDTERRRVGAASSNGARELEGPAQHVGGPLRGGCSFRLDG